ncbi:MAG TPA: hypothetical protein VMF66_03680 [Candidatus Acidoferrum sp.]|nr:hypothetical protein [Candidatus Acidoferrum sp.]
MEAHLSSCGECASELDLIEKQTLSLRALRSSEAVEPRSGFYARVMQRIEDARAANSVWSVFLEPVFAKRLVYASITMVLLLSTYIIATEPGNQAVYHAPATVTAPAPQMASSSDDADSTATPQERDAVLVNLAAYQE